MTPLMVTTWHGASIVGPTQTVATLIGDDASGRHRDEAPPMTLEVGGGHLIWPWHCDADGDLDPDLTLSAPPLAIIDDIAIAGEWLWAIYGRKTALAVMAGQHTDTHWSPAQQWMPDLAARFAFGTWLAAWWPASMMDGIPVLNGMLLRTELEALASRLDLLLTGEPAALPDAPATTSEEQDRYALAAGTDDRQPSSPLGASVTAGSCGTTWADWPSGWVDASDTAVSWRLLQDLGHWSFQVRVAAGPFAPGGGVLLVAESPGRQVALHLSDDSFGRCWVGETTGSLRAPAPSRVRVYLPGFAPATDPVLEVPAWQNTVRTLARSRLLSPRRVTTTKAASLWQAEETARRDHDEH